MVIKKSCLLLFAGLLLTLTIAAQTNKPIIGNTKTIFGEIGGPGVLSLNYDQRFKGEKGLGFRVGLGGLNILDLGLLSIPIGINYLSGSKGNYFELGTGLSSLTLFSGTNFYNNKNSTIIGYLIAGYRFQPEKKGFTGRIFLSPIFNNNGFTPIYGGVSAGIRL